MQVMMLPATSAMLRRYRRVVSAVDLSFCAHFKMRAASPQKKMGDQNMTKLRHLRLQVRPVAVALLAMASASAIAGDQQATANNDGLMTFPNVSVINAPAAATTAPAAGAAGMRAQKDRNTGQLRAPTGEEVAELEALTQAVPEAQVEVRQLANGAKAARLNEAYMSYSVVGKDASGNLTEQCVTGESAANHALHAAVVEEVRHAR
jgi:hypothetical protein